MGKKKICTMLMLLFLLFTARAAVLGESSNETSYENATFDFSTAPSRVVLSVSSYSGMSAKLYSMTLYGDGKLELRVHRGKQELEAFDITLPYEGTEKLLKLAVSHGLAEYDSARLYAEQLRLTGGEYPSGEDFPSIAVLLSLKNYQRGPYELLKVEKDIRVDAPGLRARAFPQIEEFQGLVKLSQELSRYLENERKRSKAKP